VLEISGLMVPLFTIVDPAKIVKVFAVIVKSSAPEISKSI
jgi:hypothetical protein